MQRLVEAGRGYWVAREGRDNLQAGENSLQVGLAASRSTVALSSSPNAVS